MDTAYQNFFQHGRGFPKFKSRHASRQSFQLPQGVKIDPKAKKVYLPKLGWIKARGWRKLHGKIKTCTVSYTSADDYHVSIMFQHPDLAVPVTNNGNVVGLDLGVKTFAYLSDGTRFELPADLKKKHTKLKKLHKAVSRKKQGSSNRAKAKKKLAKKYRQIANTRKDFSHKVSKQLSENQAVVIEDLNTKQMTEAKGASKKDLNREILNQGWHQFVVFLGYKLARKGNHLVKVDPAYTSQTCSRCGCVDKASRLSQSRFVCTSCNHKIHADLNAAINILNRGKHGDSLPLNTR
jgi:putative transposase